MSAGTRENRLVGCMVREARLQHGLTQEELSRRLQNDGSPRATRSWLSRIESGEIALKAWDLLHLRSILGRDFEDHFWKLFLIRNSTPLSRRRRFAQKSGNQE